MASHSPLQNRTAAQDHIAAVLEGDGLVAYSFSRHVGKRGFVEAAAQPDAPDHFRPEDAWHDSLSCLAFPGKAPNTMLKSSACFSAAIWTSCLLAASAQAPPPPAVIPLSDAHVRIVGRYDGRAADHPRLAYPGSGLVFHMQGTSAQLAVASDSDKSALTIVLDHGAPGLQLLTPGNNTVSIAMPVDAGPHTVEVIKRTETWQGILTLNGLTLAPDSVLLDPPPAPAHKLMFIGDSVSCGAGIDNNATCKPDPQLPANNVYESYGLLLGRRLDAEVQLVCYGGRGLERDYRGLALADSVLNAPDFLPLAIASDKPEGRVAWDAARFQPNAVFISLGTNDFNLQKTKPLDEEKWIGEYVAFLRKVRKDYPHAIIFVTEGAIVTDPLLREMVQRAAVQCNDPRVQYTPSAHYPGNGCDGHPTRIQHQHMADDLEPLFRRNLGW
jgi:lysophospholipase L1-like esterase